MFSDQNCFTNAFQNIQNSLQALSNRISTISSNLIANINLPVYLHNYTFSSSNGVLNPYFTIVGGSTTNQSYHRTWNLITAGMLFFSGTTPGQIIFTYDFSGVTSKYYVGIDDTLAGTLVVNGVVYDAAIYFATPIYTKKILTLTLDMSKIPQSINGSDFYFNIFIADGNGVNGSSCTDNTQCEAGLVCVISCKGCNSGTCEVAD
jgi:hypothetical protein